MGYWATIGTILWGFAVALGTLYFSSVYGLFGLLGWIGLNLILGYRMNKARTHSRPEAYDDRLTDERIRLSQEEFMRSWEEEKETTRTE